MAVHDAYARLTPYELLLPEPEFAERSFPPIGEEAAERGVDTENPAAFVMLGAVQAALAELREEDAAPESAHDHGGVLFFAYHLWRTGGAVALAQRKTLRDVAPGGTEHADSARNPLWPKTLGGNAGYIQLPQHLVWIEEARNGPPESVDGFFWFGDSRGALHLALVAGMRSDRPGYAVVPVPPQPLDTLSDWATGPAREGGGDFETSLPGAELDGLLGIRTPAEVFKLAALLLRRLVRERPAVASRSDDDPAPSDGGAHEPAPSNADAGQPRAANPTPSALPFATL